MASLYDKMLQKTMEESQPHKAEPKSQEKKPLESQQASNTASQQTGSTAVQLDREPAIQQASKPTEKVTYRFHPQGVKAIKEIKWLLFNNYGIEADLAEIAEHAILLLHQDLLASQQASKIVLQLASKPASQKNG